MKNLSIFFLFLSNCGVGNVSVAKTLTEYESLLQEKATLIQQQYSDEQFQEIQTKISEKTVELGVLSQTLSFRQRSQLLSEIHDIQIRYDNSLVQKNSQ